MARILGFEIRKAAPVVKVGESEFAARSIKSSVASASVPAARASARTLIHSRQELPAQQPVRVEGSGLSVRNVQSDPLGDWYLNLPDKVPPKQISAILRMALAGNLWQQTQLTRLMGDSWPMFAKCCFELRSAIASARYVVHPYTKPGEKPTATAAEKADVVRQALESGFDPDRFADEDSCNGMIFDLTDALINGISVTELIWNKDQTMVKASAWVHPRNLAFTPDGRIGVAHAAESGGMSFSNQVRNDLMDDPDKFLVAKFKSKSGSYLGAGWMRKLAYYWVMIVYGRDFALNFAQKYGNPFFDVAYDSGITDQGEIDRFEELAKLAANQGYIVHPNTAKIEMGQAHGMAGDNAQLAMMRLADEQCQMLLLGQTLTSSAPVNGGTRAQGEVHMDVRTERIEEHCKWVARILTEQFAVSILRQNYGVSIEDDEEKPTVCPDLNRQLSPQEQADYLQKVGGSRVPVLAEEMYKRIGMQQPEPGDKVLVGGDIVIMEDAMTQTEKQEKDFDTQLEQQSIVNEAFGNPDAVEGNVEAVMAKATPEELEQLDRLVLAAERAPYQNGEIKAVKDFVSQVANRSRL